MSRLRAAQPRGGGGGVPVSHPGPVQGGGEALLLPLCLEPNSLLQTFPVLPSPNRILRGKLKVVSVEQARKEAAFFTLPIPPAYTRSSPHLLSPALSLRKAFPPPPPPPPQAAWFPHLLDREIIPVLPTSPSAWGLSSHPWDSWKRGVELAGCGQDCGHRWLYLAPKYLKLRRVYIKKIPKSVFSWKSQRSGLTGPIFGSK